MYDTRVTSSHFKDKSYSSPYPPPPSPKLPDVDSFNCFAQLAPFSLKRLYTAQRTRFEFGALLAEKKFISLAFCLASLSKVFLRTSLSLMREKVFRVQLLPGLICLLPVVLFFS